MGFSWPWVLVSLVFVPVLLGLYLLSLRRRRAAVTWSSLSLIRAARPSSSSWKRHLPVGLLLLALAFLGLAAARPAVKTDVPSSASSVILAIDVSGSMCATDVVPNRLIAAQNAVRDFVKAQDSGVRIGLVAFSGFAELAVAPTDDHDQLLHAIDGLTTGRGTTIGAAILKSVDAISAIDPAVAPADSSGGEAGPSVPSAPTPSAPRSYAPEIVVLLTDGANTRGISPGDAAKEAAERGVRVYPIGFGTTNPTRMVCTAEQLGGSGFENPGGFGGGARLGGGFLVADEPTLREVASTTGGQYFGAQDAGQLQDVLRDLPRHVQVQHKEVEISAPLAALAVLLLLGAGYAAVRWTTFPS
jgi:Ca-activated chloride channel family protein